MTKEHDRAKELLRLKCEELFKKHLMYAKRISFQPKSDEKYATISVIKDEVLGVIHAL